MLLLFVIVVVIVVVVVTIIIVLVGTKASVAVGLSSLFRPLKSTSRQAATESESREKLIRFESF